MSLPQKLDLVSFTEDLKETFVCIDDDNDDGGNSGNPGSGGGGCCVLMAVVFKVFVVAGIALSTKKLAVGITLSASALIFLELVVARVFTLLNICPTATEVRLDSLIGKLIGKKRREEKVDETSTSMDEGRHRVPFEIIEESRDSSTLDKGEEKHVLTKEKSKSSKLKSKIVKRIVPKKLRSYKKKKKMKIRKEEEVTEEEIETEEEVVEGEDEESVTEVSSLFSDERIESEISERDEIEEEEEEEGSRSRGGITKAIVLIVIVLAGLLKGKVLAIGLIFWWCLIMRVVCWKSQASF